MERVWGAAEDFRAVFCDQDLFAGPEQVAVFRVQDERQVQGHPGLEDVVRVRLEAEVPAFVPGDAGRQLVAVAESQRYHPEFAAGFLDLRVDILEYFRFGDAFAQRLLEYAHAQIRQGHRVAHDLELQVAFHRRHRRDQTRRVD